MYYFKDTVTLNPLQKSEKVLSQFAFYRSEMTRVLDEAKQLLLLLVPLHGFEGEDSGGKEDRRNTVGYSSPSSQYRGLLFS